jgi:hypothetical protein
LPEAAEMVATTETEVMGILKGLKERVPLLRLFTVDKDGNVSVVTPLVKYAVVKDDYDFPPLYHSDIDYGALAKALEAKSRTRSKPDSKPKSSAKIQVSDDSDMGAMYDTHL